MRKIVHWAKSLHYILILFCVLHVLKVLQFFSEEDSDIYCKLNEIRPRARNVVEISDLKEGQTVMINYNTDHPLEKGYWFVIPIFLLFCKVLIIIL